LYALIIRNFIGKSRKKRNFSGGFFQNSTETPSFAGRNGLEKTQWAACIGMVMQPVYLARSPVALVFADLNDLQAGVTIRIVLAAWTLPADVGVEVYGTGCWVVMSRGLFPCWSILGSSASGVLLSAGAH
jgi:hypothetical protein